MPTLSQLIIVERLSCETIFTVICVCEISVRQEEAIKRSVAIFHSASADVRGRGCSEKQ